MVRHSEQSRRREIRRQAVSIALAVAPFGIAFGIASTQAGLAVWQASAFSLLVFAGSAQFAAVEIIGQGGAVLAAITAGLLLNLRSLAFGLIMAPALRGTRLQRILWSQLMIDETTAVGSAQPDRELQRYGYLITGMAIFVAWNLSTLVGASLVPSAGDVISDWGLDAAIPAVFLALLWPRLGHSDKRATAAAGALIALALVPVAPPGIPIIAACLAVAAGWRLASRPSV